MAEFLIYNKQHWTKESSLQAKDRWTVHQTAKFAEGAVHEVGDIVEVREDGFWETRKHRTDVFRVVKKPLLEFEKYKVLMNSVDNTFMTNGKTYLRFRRRGKVDERDDVIDKLGIL